MKSREYLRSRLSIQAQKHLPQVAAFATGDGDRNRSGDGCANCTIPIIPFGKNDQSMEVL